jgi:UDP-3-O-[3-hydroxymyristoyl] N-acetylglucosamine deacetylase
MRLVPAEAGTGIRFRRTDLDGFEIPAVWRHVAKVSYATSLMREGVLLQTTEHLLSCLYASGIDNLIVEINNLEVPIVDGSALPFVEMLQTAGLRTLDRARRYLKIVKPVEAVDGDKRIRIEPSEDFEIICESRFNHELVGSQTLSLTIDPEVYAREIAPARTFGFEADLDQMREMGLIRGATLENAVCFGAGGVLNPGGLRFRDEPCRHKLLDLIGDLAMLGRPLLGKVIAARAGHAMHIALVRRIMDDPACYEVTERAMAAAAGD